MPSKTIRPLVSSITKNFFTTQRRSFTPTNLLTPSPSPSTSSNICKHQKRPPPRLILSPETRFSGNPAFDSNKRERRFGNVRSKEIPMSVLSRLGGHGSVGQLRMITEDVKKDDVKQGAKTNFSDNESHNMRYEMSASKTLDLVNHEITACRRFNGVLREPTQKKKFSTVASKEAWENKLKIAEEKREYDGWIATLWWFRAY